MEKRQLAYELRQRQYHLYPLDWEAIDALSDDEIIDRYITCADRERKQVTPQELRVVIKLATTIYQFFDFCARLDDLRLAPALSRRRGKARRQRWANSSAHSACGTSRH